MCTAGPVEPSGIPGEEEADQAAKYDQPHIRPVEIEGPECAGHRAVDSAAAAAEDRRQQGVAPTLEMYQGPRHRRHCHLQKGAPPESEGNVRTVGSQPWSEVRNVGEHFCVVGKKKILDHTADAGSLSVVDDRPDDIGTSGARSSASDERDDGEHEDDGGCCTDHSYRDASRPGTRARSDQTGNNGGHDESAVPQGCWRHHTQCDYRPIDQPLTCCERPQSFDCDPAQR